MTLDTGVSLPHSFPKGLVIDQDHDLIAVEVGGDHGHFATAQFLNLEQDMYSGDLQDQMSLVTLGNPFAGRIPIPGNQKASGVDTAPRPCLIRCQPGHVMGSHRLLVARLILYALLAAPGTGCPTRF